MIANKSCDCPGYVVQLLLLGLRINGDNYILHYIYYRENRIRHVLIYFLATLTVFFAEVLSFFKPLVNLPLAFTFFLAAFISL